MNYKVIVAATLALAASGAAYWQFKMLHPAHDGNPPSVTDASADVAPAAASAAAAPETYPIDSSTTAELLPQLEHSDPVLGTVIQSLIGTAAFTRWVRQDQIAQRIVVTVDALGRSAPAFEQRLLRFVGGTFRVDGDELRATIAPDNAARYQPLMMLLATTDVHTAYREYTRLYPLLQSAWQALGYSDGHFNDRLVAVIDLLLATPDVAPPIELQRPGVMYVYADPKLEALSSGQKILLRVGREHAAQIKNRLRELRALVTTGHGAPTASPALR